MATHSSILAWRILCTEEPGGLQSIGSQRVRHNNTLSCLGQGGVFSAPHIDHQNVDLTHTTNYFSIKYWIILYQQIILIQAYGHGELSANLFQKCRGELLYRGERKWEDYSEHKVHGFSLAELCPSCIG